MTKRASSEIIAQLRAMIITGQLAPGSVVTEAHLLDLLGCGRTPLREALHTLTEQYMLLTPPRRGILVPQLDILDFQQSHEAALVLGEACAEIAAARIDDNQLDSLDEILVQQKEADQGASFYDLTELDWQFHSLIAQATGNRYLKDVTERVHNSAVRFTYKANAAAGTASMSVEEHRKIVEALRSRNPDLARRRLHDHISAASDRVLSILGRRGNISPS